jgi:hypothetical protein
VRTARVDRSNLRPVDGTRHFLMFTMIRLGDSSGSERFQPSCTSVRAADASGGARAEWLLPGSVFEYVS